MKSIPKFMATVVVLMIAVLVCVSLLFAGITVTTAKTHHNNVIAALEDSDFSNTVINECVENAEKKGYSLVVTEEINMSGETHYRAVLSYDVILPLFGKVHTGKWVGYAYPGATIYGADADHYFEINDNGVLGIKATYRWATGLDSYASDNGKDSAGSKNDLLPTEITIPTYFNGVKVVALRDYMFAGNAKLLKLNFEEGVEEIGDYAFKDCVNLDNSVEMPSSVDTIGESAFENCTKLDGVSFKATSVLGTIGDYAFKNCAEFVNVTLPDSMTKNGFGAFQGCVNLKSYKAPFVGASPTASKKSGGYIGYIFGASDYKEHNTTVPSGLSDVNITSYVTGYACYDMDQLKTLTLGDNITNFDMWPFALCDGLTSVTIPKNVVETEYAAFYQCSNLETVSFAVGSKMTTLGSSNFADCGKLKNIQLPNTIRSIGPYCFEECDSLTFQTAATGKIPEGVETIGNGAYSYCDSPSFTTLVIPSTVTSIDYAFTKKSTHLTRISVASGNEAYCTGEKGELLTIDKSMVVQYPYAGPVSYTVPSSVTTIFHSAFDYCENLTTLNFAADSKLTTIESSAFSHCSDISGEVVLPASVVTIDDYAFYHAGKWSTFKIGSKVTSIGTYAFYDAGGIAAKTYLLMTTAPTIESSAFFTNTVSSGTITKNYVYVKNSAVKNVFVDGSIYRSAYTTVTVDSSIS